MTPIQSPATLNTIQRVLINNFITASELRILDEQGENLGVMTRDAALTLAKEKGLDLIELSAKAKPPVARIMSFDKYRYDEMKKLKKQRAAQKGGELKQVQLGVGTAKNDLEIKAKKVNEFLAEGSQVEIMLTLRGRQKALKEFALERLRNFLTFIDPEHKIILAPRFVGKGFVVQIMK